VHLFGILELWPSQVWYIKDAWVFSTTSFATPWFSKFAIASRAANHSLYYSVEWMENHFMHLMDAETKALGLIDFTGVKAIAQAFFWALISYLLEVHLITLVDGQFEHFMHETE
jgi:hypothetical protein